jgi:hypothetical protein
MPPRRVLAPPTPSPTEEDVMLLVERAIIRYTTGMPSTVPVEP